MAPPWEYFPFRSPWGVRLEVPSGNKGVVHKDLGRPWEVHTERHGGLVRCYWEHHRAIVRGIFMDFPANHVADCWNEFLKRCQIDR